MSNELTLFAQGNTALPASIAQFAEQFAVVNADAAAGIKSAGHPRISFGGRRFHLSQPGLDDIELPNTDLKVVVVGVNPNLSRTFYTTGYDPKNAGAPVCASDNGKFPAAWVKAPQCASCAACPHAVFGSKVQDGRESTACATTKRLAVIWEGQPETVYGIRLSYNSTKNFAEYFQLLQKGNALLPTVITRLYFTQDTVPVVKFDAVGYIPEGFVATVRDVLDSDEVKLAVGMDDASQTPAQVTGLAAIGLKQEVVQTGFTAVVPQVQPQGGFSAPAAAPQVQSFAPAPAAQQETHEAPKRHRRTKAEIDADNAKHQAENQAPQGFGGFGGNTPAPEPTGFGGSAAAAVAVNPSQPDPELSGLLNNAFLKQF